MSGSIICWCISGTEAAEYSFFFVVRVACGRYSAAMRGQLCLVFLAASFGATLDGASLTFSGSVETYAIEYTLPGNEPAGGGGELYYREGGCFKSAEGASVNLTCEYASISPGEDAAFVEATGSGDRKQFRLMVYTNPMLPYYIGEDLIWVDGVTRGAVRARVQGLYYITGGRGEASFQIGVYDESPDWSPLCSLYVDGVGSSGDCYGSFQATFGKPFYLDYEVRLYVGTTIHTTEGAATAFLSSVRSGQRSYPLYVVPEGATGGLVVVGLAGLAGWGRWRSRGDGLERLRGSLSSD